MGRDRLNLYGLDLEALRGLMANRGVPTFHGDQAYRWIYRRGCFDLREWTDLPRTLRESLARETRVDPGRIDGRTEAADGSVKYRLALPDGGAVEAVHMVQASRVTLCLSSQVGCALDCDFCLTGKMGLVRQMTAGEIVGQFALIRDDQALGERAVNLVFMGMGEPLHNYDAVLDAFRLLTDADGLGVSRRRITVSTAGLAPAIERLAGEPRPPRLAVSLNATTDEVRSRIMPINRKYPLDRLLDACRLFKRETGEAFTLEYVLLRAVNDGDDDVARLGRIARSHGAKLNLIPFNPLPDRLPYAPTDEARVVAIRDRLLREGVRVSIRWSRGADARAACGQLALLPGEPGSEPPRRAPGEPRRSRRP